MARRISLTTRSAGALWLDDFALIFVPYGHCDETKILPWAKPLFGLKGPDGGHALTAPASRPRQLLSEDALKFLLSLDPKTTDQIFEIYKNSLKEEKYLSVHEHDKKFKIFKVLIMHSPIKFINYFCEDEDFLNIFLFDSLSKILSYAEEQDILEWIGNDQEKLKFWIENAQLLITKDNSGVIWVDYLTNLLDRSDSPYQTLEEIINNNIFRYRNGVVYSGSWSDVMKQKLPYIADLKIKLKDTHLEFLSLVNKKEQDWLKQIDLQALKDDKESKRRSERFDW